VHESHACGGTNVVWLDDSLYVMERSGSNPQPGLLFALNNSGGSRRERVKTRFADTRLSPLAWRAKDEVINPREITPDGDGWADIEVPRLGYVVYGV
jgi:alpha-amylase